MHYQTRPRLEFYIVYLDLQGRYVYLRWSRTSDWASAKIRKRVSTEKGEIEWVSWRGNSTDNEVAVSRFINL